jgi:hypothetical protein
LFETFLPASVEDLRMSDAEKSQLRRANDNPWYCLATLYGEQEANGDWDEDLAAKNRVAWNRWMAAGLSEEQRAELVRKWWISEPELEPLTPAEKSAICNDFASRAGRGEMSPPTPTDVVDFTRTHFDTVVTFEGFLYVADAKFNSATFSGEANFRSATFAGYADFKSATFSGDANFLSATFSDVADFRSATFSGNAYFRSTFSGDTYFESAAFSSRVDFRDATFFFADFLSAAFSGDTYFGSATFSGVADFRLATFSDSAHFGLATFSGEARFGSATFSGEARFESATFPSVIYFESTTFSGNAHFESATFPGYAFFQSATFSGNADFRSATFSSYADFGSATFSGYADFGSATFSSSAAFINAGFAASTFFRHSRFRTEVPDFRGAKMHEATEWHGVHWPPAPKDESAAQAQVYAYERLRQEMERLKKHEDEQFFFRKELRARRGLISRWSGAWLLNYLYEASSNYGQSIARPLLWLIGVFAIGVAFFVGAPVFNGTRMPVPRAAGLSFANIFSFLPIKREIMTPEMITGLSSAAQIVGVVQSLLGVVLLFLLGLALRSRFRMR